MPGNPLVRFDEGRVGRAASVALSPTLPADRFFCVLCVSAVKGVPPLQHYRHPRFRIHLDSFPPDK